MKWLMNGLTVRLLYKLIKWLIDRLFGKLIGRSIFRLMRKLIDLLIDRLVNELIGWLIYRLNTDPFIDGIKLMNWQFWLRIIHSCCIWIYQFFFLDY